MTKKLAVVWYVLVTLLIGTLFVAIKAEVVRTTSVDLAHNYALVFRLAENSQLLPNDPTLGEMNIYPSGSHAIAAFVGKLVDSSFLGMHLSSLVSVVLLWASCMAILYAAPNRSGPFNAMVLAAVVILNFGAFRIHGSEIVRAYYYAQLMGQSLIFAAIAAAIWLDGRLHRAWIYALMLGVIHVVSGIHLLPALELLGLLAGVALLDAVFAQGSARARIGAALLSGAVIAAGIAVVLLHPSFAAMRSISLHNGGIWLGPLRAMWAVVIVSLIVLASSVSLLRAWYRDRAGSVAYKYLAVYGAAVAALFLLQVVLRHFNLGSDYAAKKYGFGLVTFLFLRLALWLGPKLRVRLERQPQRALWFNSGSGRLAVFGLALAATLAGIAHSRRGVDTMAVAGIERQLIALHATSLPAPVAGKPNLVVDTEGMPDVINYMFTTAVARMPREAALRIFEGGERLQPLTQLSQYGYILSSRGSSRFARADHCARLPSGPILVLDGACVDQVAAGTPPAVAAAAAR